VNRQFQAKTPKSIHSNISGTPTNKRFEDRVRTTKSTLWVVRQVLFFSFTRPARTVAPILMLNGSNDVFPPKDGPFGRHDDGWRHLANMCPKSSPKGVDRQFQAKMAKSIQSISPELLIGPTGDFITELRPQCTLRGWSAINPKQTQHAWRPPCWKLIWHHISAADGPIWIRFGMLIQNNVPVMRYGRNQNQK